MFLLRFVLYSLIAVISSFVIHEFSHWILGELMGYEMRMTLNTVYPTSGKYDKSWHYPLISSIGPIVTLLQALTIFYLIKRYSMRNLYPFLFSAFYLELLSTILNFSRPNDLGRISVYFGLGLFTLPIVFVTAHSILNFVTIKREKYSKGFVLLTFVLVLVFSSLWILLNQRYKIVLI